MREPPGKTTDQDDAFNFDHIFEAELNAINCRRHNQNKTDDDHIGTKEHQDAWSMNLLGLAFSGGGIRSATFNLGIIQSLAELKLLNHVDYLSTVSGGGYIGSWLTAQYYREQQNTESEQTEKVEDSISSEKKKSLPPNKIGFSYQNFSSEPNAIRYLRQHSNYLTPKAGLLTADTWSIFVTYVRSGLLNLMILTCLIAVALMIPRLLVAWGSIMIESYNHQGTAFIIASAVSVGLGLYAAYVIGYNLAWYHINGQRSKSQSSSTTRYWVTLTGFAITVFLIHIFSICYLHKHPQLILPFNYLQLNYLLIATSFFLIYAISGLCDPDRKSLNIDTQDAVVFKVVIPIIIISFIASLVLPTLVNAHPNIYQSLLRFIIGTTLTHLVVWSTAFFGSCHSYIKNTPESILQTKNNSNSNLQDQQQNEHETRPAFQRMWLLILINSVISGLIMGALLYVFTQQNLQLFNDSHLLIKFGPPIYVLWLFLLSVLHTGLIGRGMSDVHREWLNRLGAWLLIFSVAWLLITGLSFYSPLLIDWLSASKYIQTSMVSGWVLTTIAGLIASRETRGENTMSGVRKLILIIAPYVFILGMIAFVSSGLNTFISTSLQPFDKSGEIRQAYESYQDSKLDFASEDKQTVQIQQNSPDYSNHSQQSTDSHFSPILKSYIKLLNSHDLYPLHITLLLFCIIAVMVFLSWRIDITEFSLHRLYGNRLTRCYLGASNAHRKHQPFTGFSKDDDIPLHKLITKNAANQNQAIGPYHLINTAINLVSGQDLAWQERKAGAFLLSPLYCGFDPQLNGSEASQHEFVSSNGYRPTNQFATIKPSLDSAQTEQHLTLGDAMTTSGAAASPNMGSHSSAIYSILLAVFNIRLGRWIGNPRHKKTYRKSGPAISLRLLIAEIFGLTRSDTKYVYLSDGGHFENLGIYELVHRRCRFIIAIDAGADPQFKFDDLGNAIRKCRNDFGVSINIDVSKIRERNAEGFNAWPCAIGTIDYSDTKTGTLLYIKSSLLKDAPEDVLNYAAQNPTFPHQTTGDQFFTESQFESYRYLGYHIGMKVLADACITSQETTSGSI